MPEILFEDIRMLGKYAGTATLSPLFVDWSNATEASLPVVRFHVISRSLSSPTQRTTEAPSCVSGFTVKRSSFSRGVGSEPPPSKGGLRGGRRGVWVGGGGVSCFYLLGNPLTDGLTQCLCIDHLTV